VVVRRTEYELEKAREKSSHPSRLFDSLGPFRLVILLIRSSADPETAKKWLD